MNFEKCDCGELCNIEDLIQSEISHTKTCSNCGTYCTDCGKMISETEITKNGCYACDIEF